MTERTNAEFIADARGPGHVATDCILFLNEALDRLDAADAENTRLREACEKSHKFIDAIMGFYGQGLGVINWHLNGDSEPWDNFFDDNMDGDELETLEAVLKAKSAIERETET